jgi:hypothetical protein
VYAKIFTSIFDGSMRGHSDLILVFVNLLCHADQDGMVDRHWRAIADETGLTHDQVRSAVAALEGPDGESRSRNDDGRRIRRIDPERDWGWEIINYQHYRHIRSMEERREYMRNLMRKKRRVLAPVSTPLAMLAKAEAEVEVDIDIETEKKKTQPAPSISTTGKVKSSRKFFIHPTPAEVTAYAQLKHLPVTGEAFCDHYESNGWRVGKNPMKSWQAAVRTWGRNHNQFSATKQTAINTGYAPTTDQTQRANDLARAKEEYAGLETWRSAIETRSVDLPKWANREEVDARQRGILSDIEAKYGADAAAEVRKPKEEQV